MGLDNQLLIGGVFAGLLLVGYGARCQTGLSVLVSLNGISQAIDRLGRSQERNGPEGTFLRALRSRPARVSCAGTSQSDRRAYRL